MVWGKAELTVFVTLVSASVGWFLLVCCSTEPLLVPTVVPTRSGEEVIATAKAHRTATTTSREIAHIATATATTAKLEACEELARTAERVSAVAAPELGAHGVSVFVASLKVDKTWVNPTIYGGSASKDTSVVDAYHVLINECLPLAEQEYAELTHLQRVAQAKDKASQLLMGTVAPMVTATAGAHATARAENATVRSKGVTFKCDRLRMAQREVGRDGASVYSHVANIMTIVSDGMGEYAYFDSYDAKTALEQCP